MNLTNRGVTVSRSGAPSGEPVLAEVGAPVILSLGIAGYCGVRRTPGRPMKIGASGIAVLCAALPLWAAEVEVTLTEKRTALRTAYAVDMATGTVRGLPEAKGEPLAVIQTYRVESRRLCAASCIADAEEILFQGRAGTADVVVVRKEYNSFSNPLRWLAAFSGHPIQVSSIRVVVLVAGARLKQVELVDKPSSYDWEASVVQ
jgi:hypothetical protein